MKPLAIIGLGPTHDDAPWTDEDWERWGILKDAFAPSCHFVFEIHDASEWDYRFRPYRYSAIERMNEIGVPVYLQKPHAEVPLSVEYPLDEVGRVSPNLKFGSTIAYMMALAIHQGRDFGLWGVDLSEKLYDHQRPNLAHLIGLAEGRGLTVSGPSTDSILAFSSDMEEWGYFLRYGYLSHAEEGLIPGIDKRNFQVSR